MFDYSLPSLPDERYALRWVALSAPVVAAIGLLVPALLGAHDIALLGAYLALPLFLLPVLYRLSLPERTAYPVPVSVAFEPPALTTVYFFSLSVALLLASAFPRPSLFFAALALCNTVALVYCLLHGGRLVPLSFVSITTFVFHLSSTVPRAFYIGSGDSGPIILGVQNTVEQGRLVPGAGYDLFPAFHSLMAVGQNVLGINTHDSTFILGAVVMVAALWFTLLLSDRLPFIPARYAALPSILLLFTYNFYYVGLYTIPRKIYGLFAIVPLAIVVGYLYSDRVPRRFVIILGSAIFTLALLHKLAHLWFGSVIAVFVVAVTVAEFWRRRSEGSPLSLSSGGAALCHVWKRAPVFYILAAYFALYLYLLFQTQIPPQVAEIASGIAMWLLQPQQLFVGEGGGGGYMLRNPVGTFVSLVGNSVIIIFLFVGTLVGLFSDSIRLKSFAVATAFLSLAYFPGVPHVLLSVIELDRMAKIISVFVVVLAAIGLITAWERSQNPARALLILLVLTGGFFILTSDMYTRDNPSADSGTFTNYLTEPELAGTVFASQYGEDVAFGIRSQNYVFYEFNHAEISNRGSVAEPVVLESTAELCEPAVLYSMDEIDRRGAVLYQDGITITDESDFPFDESKPIVYENGHDRLYGPVDC